MEEKKNLFPAHGDPSINGYLGPTKSYHQVGAITPPPSLQQQPQKQKAGKYLSPALEILYMTMNACEYLSESDCVYECVNAVYLV